MENYFKTHTSKVCKNTYKTIILVLIRHTLVLVRPLTEIFLLSMEPKRVMPLSFMIWSTIFILYFGLLNSEFTKLQMLYSRFCNLKNFWILPSKIENKNKNNEFRRVFLGFTEL